MKKINSNTVNLISHFKIPALLFLSLFALFPLISQAAVITVPGDHPTIQSAIDAAVHGDEIIVSPGIYYETANFSGKNIILRSTDPTRPTVVASTIIVGRHKKGVIFSGTELTTCVLSGFTIAGGGGSQAGTACGIFGNRTLATIEYNTITSNTAVNIWGGYVDAYGIYRCDGIIRYNTIANNWAFSCMGSMGVAYGGGVYACDGNIHDNVIAHNSFAADNIWPWKGGSWGGGLVGGRGTIENNIISNNYPAGVTGCRGTIQNNTIYENSSGVSGCDGTIQNNTIYENSGGISGCDGTIQNNTIHGNSGRGIYGCDGTIQNNAIYENFGGGLHHCYGNIQNNIIYGNTADYPGGGLASCKGTIRNCIIWQNTAPTGAQVDNYCATPSYSCIQDWVGGGTGNILDNPELVDPTSGDFHLQPNSPCIDAGENVPGLTQDFEGDPRPYDAVTWESRGDGSDFDIGADEFIGTAVPTPIPTPTPTPCVIMVPGDYPTIQAAIDAARHGCEIIVSPDVYYENIHFHGKNIILRSTDPTSPTIVASTIIDGNQAGPVVTFSGTEYRNCMLSGFTITNGSAYISGGIRGNGTMAAIENNNITSNTAGRGGGLYQCHGTIQNNTISGNSAGDEGGGLYDCDGTMQNNTISGNSADINGGGLYDCDGTIQNNTISGNSADINGAGLYDCYGTIQNNTISGNSAGDEGGGLLWCFGTIQNNVISGNSAGDEGGGLHTCGGNIQNNEISNNSALYGGGLYDCDGTIQNNSISGNSATIDGGGLNSCHAIIQNNVISGNSAGYNGGGLLWCLGTIQNNTIYGNVASYSGGGLYDCTRIIRNCIIWQNTANSGGAQFDDCTTPSYSCIQDWTGGGTGNITDDPQLTDPANGDFHLEASSPCVDAGFYIADLTQDFEGDPRPWDAISEPRGDGSDYDIGADEYTTKTTLAVFSEHDSPAPPVGINTITTGTLINAYMTDPVVAESRTQYLCTGWLGEGAVPASGIVTSFTFVLDQPSTITWLWQTQGYYLNATSNPPQGGLVTLLDGVTPATGWHNVGEVADVQAVSEPDYQFDYWSGDLSGSNNPESITMDSPKSINANFSPIPTPTPTPTPTPIIPIYLREYNFDSSVEGWSFLAISSPDFSPASSSYSAGRLGINSPNDSTSRVGIWTGPLEISYVPDNVYRAKFTVCSSMGSFAADPQFRMRWNQDQSLESTSHIVNACGSYSYSLPLDPSTQEYSCYFMPVVSGNLGVAFDMLDFEVDRFGTHYVDSVTVERFPRPAAGTAVKTYTDSSDFANWSFITNVGYGPVTSGGAGTETLSITSRTTDTSNYGCWQSSVIANELTYEEDNLYRATFTLRCESEWARNIMPQVRLRCQNEDGQMTQTMELNAQGIGPGAMPEVSGTNYEVYWETPILPGSPTIAEDGFIVAFDLLDFDPTKGGTIYLDSVAIDYLEIP